jgi:hypothetical protein
MVKIMVEVMVVRINIMGTVSMFKIMVRVKIMVMDKVM